MSLDQAKRWLNLDADITEDDELIEGLIKSAREMIERETRVVLIDSIFELTLEEFPCSGEIRLPVQPLIGVIDVQYLGNDGELTTLDAGDWIEVKHDEPPRIVMHPSGNWWPALNPRPGNVVVTFRAGYESAGSPQDAERVPSAIKTALQMMLAHWYEHREAVSSDHRNTPTEMPLGAQRLLDSYRRIL